MEIYIILGVSFLSLLMMIVLMIKQNSQYKKLNQSLNLETSKLKEDSTQQLNRLSDRFDLKMIDLIERNLKNEQGTSESLNRFHNELSTRLNSAFLQQQELLERRLYIIDKKVNESLNEGFEKTHQTFTNIAERLSKIDEAQKNIETLSSDIVSLQSILTDKSARGAFGEVQLNHILISVFGERNDRVYKTQVTFSNNTRVDAVLYAPEPLGTLAIDAKFPLESYQKLINETPNTPSYKESEKQFIQDIRKHIDDISSKYILPYETSNQALMFIPAEAIFAYINAYHQNLIHYAQKKNVWIVSPTTLMSTLTTLQTILINIERDKYAKEIQKQLSLLNVEFDRYRSRWDKLANRLDQVSKDVKDIHITTDKITDRFNVIKNVEEIE